MEACPICTNNYTSSLRRDIICPKCQYKACLVCYKQYISTSQTHVCINPNCEEELPDDVIYNNFPKTYIQKEYKNILLNRLYDEERSMIPQTMVIIERREQTAMIHREIRTLEEQIREKRNDMMLLSNPHTDKETHTFINKCPESECRGFLNKQYSCSICKKHFCSSCLEEKNR